MTNSTGNWPPPGSAGGVATMVRMPGMPLTFVCTSGTIWNTVRLRSPHGLSTRPPKPLSGKVIWKVWLHSGTLMQLAVDRFGVEGGLVNRGIRRRLDDAHDEALVFRGRQFLGRHHEHREWSAGSARSRR